jgi:predicted DNA-binding antitoxin AbrB/MazE fold protein
LTTLYESVKMQEPAVAAGVAGGRLLVSTTVEAVYQGGVFKPLRPVDLPENQRVRLNVDSMPATDFQAWLDRIRPVQQRIIAQFGILPDSAPIIAENRGRDG